MGNTEKTPNDKLRYQREIRGWSQKKVAFEVDTNKEMVGRWERGVRIPSKYYQAKLCELFEKNAEELGFMPSPTANKDSFGSHTEQIQQNAVIPAQAEKHDTIEQEQPLFDHSLLSQAIKQGITEAVHELEGNIIDQLRRQVMQQTLKATGVTILPSYAYDTMLGSELVERLSQALTKPSLIDEGTLLYLTRRIGNYWQDRNDVIIPPQNLLPYVMEDLRKITTFLDGSLLPSVRTRLCSIAGAAAMLIGELYYDMNSHVQARSFHTAAITAAHEANNQALEAVAWGRKSFSWTYDSNTREAVNCIQQARYFAGTLNSTIRTWLAAVEAEIQANLGDRDASLKALKEAIYVAEPQDHQTDNYWIHFDESLSAGYQGVSFLRLSNLGHKDLVPNAQAALQNALDLLIPSMKRRQPTLLIDLAGTYVQQGNIEQACSYASQAVHTATQINSKVSLQRLNLLRDNLEPWKETRYVQELDQAIRPILTSERQQKTQ